MSAQGPMSCQKLATLCQGESCCTSITVPGGAFKMGRSTVSGSSDYYSDGLSYEVPEHDAIVSSFALDKYEVTVGRFRSFVEVYDAWHKPPASNPQIGTGSNQNATASVRGRTGWQQNWTPNDNDLPADSAAVKTMLIAGQDQFSTWTETAGTNEAFPINNVSWTLAFAFCIWDGGRLPTEAEWNYAAAGGSEQRVFPWSIPPDNSIAPANAVYYGNADASGLPSAVGSKSCTSPQAACGDGRWGQSDLAGNVYEWTLDYYTDPYPPTTCVDCCTTSVQATHVVRGGSLNNDSGDLLSAERVDLGPTDVQFWTGFRCVYELKP